MKTLILALLTILTVLTPAAQAGAYHSVTIESNVTPTFDLVIPKGKAITIVNFQDVTDTNPAQLLIQLGDPATVTFAPYLTASAGNLNTGVAQKDFTICGPATAKIAAAPGHFVYLCYKLFAN